MSICSMPGIRSTGQWACLASHLTSSKETGIRDRLTDLRSQSGNGGLQILFLLPVLLVLLFPAGENRKEPS